MPFEMICGLLVADDARYSQYRMEIAPLLEAAGGAFQYDFQIAKTLKSAVAHDINRVFVLRFPDRDAKQRFFAAPQYREIRARLFEGAVRHVAIIAEYST